MRTVAFCEADESCRQVLRKHWPDIPIHNDVRELDGKQYRGTVELISGGYPCQPFSIAGKRKGQEDDRHLWPEYRRLIAEVRPNWILAENVTGHITLGLDEVLSDLEGLEYTATVFIIPAASLNAWHRRDRIWIIANANGDEVRQQPGRIDGPRREGSTQPGLNGSAGTLADCPGDGQPEAGEGITETWRDGIVGISRWQAEPELGRVVDGVSGQLDEKARAERIRQLGNAVCPPIVEVIGRAIIEADNRFKTSETKNQEAI